MAESIRFIHLTDLHVVHPDHPAPKVHSDTNANVRAAIAQINALAPRPAFVAVSGDLTNHGDVDSFRTLRDLMAPLAVPVLYALGNHDSRPGFYQGLLGRDDAPDAPYDHEAVIGGAHVITLDTSRRGRIGGSLDEAQFAFLAAALDRHPGLPKLLMLHHGPSLDLDPAGEWESLRVADTLRLAEVVRDRNVAGMLSGHLHLDRVAHWHGIPVILGMSLHCALDPLHAGDGIRMVSGTSFTLCELRPSGLTVTFAPQPSDRAERTTYTLDQLRAHEAAMAA
jgi:Icc protein